MRSQWLFFGVLGMMGCSALGSGASAEKAPAPPGRAETTGNAPALPPDAPPPVTGTPKEDELTEKFGFFVSLVGTPDGDGTRDKPLSTISAAIEKAKASAKRVYVCKGTYDEAVVLTNAVSVIGGYDCATKWTTDDSGRSKIVAPSSPALRATDILNATSFIGFDVVAPDATEASGSSIGFLAQNAPALTLSHGSITAGKGGDGSAGVDANAVASDAAFNGTQGEVGEWELQLFAPVTRQPIPVRSTGGAGGVNACNGRPAEAGGTGGSGGTYKCETKQLRDPLSGHLITFRRFVAESPRSDGQARSGTDGAAGVDGVSASGLGVLSAEGFVPSDGSKGGDGTPGGGGSGGNGEPAFGDSEDCPADKADTGYRLTGNAGSGGGAGGCGGLAGSPGHGGGASIGSLISASEGMSFDDVIVSAASGGKGGKGTLGTAPTAGGAPGTQNANTTAGAAGGNGGRPGVSGSGAGGPSIGIAHTGGAPTLVNNAAAKAGNGGDGVAEDKKSAVGMTWKLPASAAGLAEDMHAF